MRFDLVIRGGELVDPAARRRGRFDLGIVDGRVAAVERELPDGAAHRELDAGGLLVVPGLVDLHTHVYDGSTYWGIDVAEHAARSGATTWVDAGSAGAHTLRGLRRIAGAAPVRVRAFLNLSSIGLVAPTWELATPGYLDEAGCLKAIEANRDFVVGVKARIDRDTVGTLGLEPLRAARRVAERAGLRLMVHIAEGPPEVAGVLELLREGDVLTHCATPASMSLVDGAGAPRPGVREAVERGVRLDVGHGAGSFAFRTAAALVDAGLAPHTISSDIHQVSVRGPMRDLPTCLTKYLALGLALEDVLHAATAAPAALIGEHGRLGTLQEGAVADVCLLRLEPGSFELEDVLGERRRAAHRLRAVRTLAAGRELVDQGRTVTVMPLDSVPS